MLGLFNKILLVAVATIAFFYMITYAYMSHRVKVSEAKVVEAVQEKFEIKNETFTDKWEKIQEFYEDDERKAVYDMMIDENTSEGIYEISI